MLNTIKKLPSKFIYEYLIYLRNIYEEIKFELLEYLEDKGESKVIKDKILYFKLICKFKPERAREQAETLNISEYKTCLEIAENEKCWSVVAFIQFKQGQFKEALSLYSNL